MLKKAINWSLLQLFCIIMMSLVVIANESEFKTCGHFDPNKKKNMARIVGGRDAPRMIPWQVHIDVFSKKLTETGEPTENQYDQSLCGGVLLDQFNVLSAAHCMVWIDEKTQKTIEMHHAYVTVGQYWYPKKGRVIRTGNTNPAKNMPIDWPSMEVFRKDVIWHEEYNHKHIYDIAILKLPEPYPLSQSNSDDDDRPGTICLPTADDGVYDEVDQSDCFISGWGQLCEHQLDPEALQWARLPIRDEKYCNNTVDEFDGRFQLCGIGNSKTDIPGTCYGDSGGPWQCRRNGSTTEWVLMGLVSGSNGECGAKETPIIFAKVAKFIPWINKRRRREKPPKPVVERTTTRRRWINHFPKKVEMTHEEQEEHARRFAKVDNQRKRMEAKTTGEPTRDRPGDEEPDEQEPDEKPPRRPRRKRPSKASADRTNSDTQIVINNNNDNS